VDRPRPRIPQGEREDAVEAFNRPLHAPQRDGFEDDLGVRVSAPADGPAGLLDLAAEILGVVQFAVVDRDPSLVGCVHGLRARGRQVDDRKPPVAKSDPRIPIDPGALRIRSAMPEHAGHGRKGVADIRRRSTRPAQDSG
jgi:hypothetical protein